LNIPHLGTKVLVLDNWYGLINLERFKAQAAKAYMANPLQFGEPLVFSQENTLISEENGHFLSRPMRRLGNADQMIDVFVGTN
jgi:hypothetical protein